MIRLVDRRVEDDHHGVAREALDHPVLVRDDGDDLRPVRVQHRDDLLAGKQPVKLFEGLSTGFWMHVHVDTICSLRQQYHP